MKNRTRNNDWSEFLVTAERLLRVYTKYIEPTLIKHEAENISLTNILFLISIGDGESKVSDIVRQGRYVGSNASYALKALVDAKLIQRTQDAKDRRNALVSWTEKGSILVEDIKKNSTDTSGLCKNIWEPLKAFENHCARTVDS